MTGDSIAHEAMPAQPQQRPIQVYDGRRTAVRIGIAVLVAGLACLGMWFVLPHSLPRPTGIIGYPVYHNYSFISSFWAYRLVVYGFPIVAVVVFAVLTRWGPLRRRTRPSTALAVPLVDPEPIAAGRTGSPGRVSIVVRLAIPTAVVVASAAARDGRLLSLFTVACALLYLVLVGATAAVGARWWSRRRGLDATAAQPTPGWSQFRSALAVANGLGGGAAAILGVWFVSEHSVVIGPGFEDSVPWLSWWLAVLGVAALSFGAVRRLRAGRRTDLWEYTVLVYLVTSIGVFLSVSKLSAGIEKFQGFDDSQGPVGADLLHRGFLPWRDQLFVHGLWTDVLQTDLSMRIFGPTVWANFTGFDTLFAPLTMVGLYLFGAWVSKGNSWFSAFCAVLLLAGYPRYMEARFILVAFSLILLGETLRRDSRVWSVGLTLVLFVQAILVPETSFLAVPALACVVLADLRHRVHGQTLWQSLRRSRWCAATGVAALSALVIVLAAFGAFRSFVDYYVVFGPGHNESGAVPVAGASRWMWTLFGTSIAAILMSLWFAASRMYRRASWTAQDWAALALTGFLLFYGEKALGRFDHGHVSQVFEVAIPLILYCLWRLVRLTGGITTPVRWRVRSSGFFARAAAPALLVVGLVWNLNPLYENTQDIGRQHRLTGVVASTVPRIGYALPSAVDGAMLADLNTTLRAYAGADEPVFDMTNSLGYVYFLLQRDPATRFTHIDMAIPPAAQRMVIDELKESQPPVVIFDARSIGMPLWDDVRNNIRHYEISQYVLDGWVPVLRTHDNLILLRRDLAARAQPIPTLSQPPLTTDLWFSGPACDWGASPNYLDTVPTGPTLSMPIGSWAPTTVVNASGWAAEPATGQPARSVVLVNDGKAVVSVSPSGGRPDVATALGNPAADKTGFALTATLDGPARPSLYLLGADDKLHPMPGAPAGDVTSVEFPDGRVVPIGPPTGGAVDEWQADVGSVGRAEVPAGTDLTDYPLATLAAGSKDLGAMRAFISDDLQFPGHQIRASSLAGLGADLPLRVGSCLQWRGYASGKPLYVFQSGGELATTLTLSGVRPAN